jgi:hypothetical protein
MYFAILLLENCIFWYVIPVIVGILSKNFMQMPIFMMKPAENKKSISI